MAYVKQVWKDLPDTSTPITAEALNHMEQGIYEANVGISNAYKNVKVDSTTLTASGEDTLELIAGNNITLTPNSQDKSVTITASGGSSAGGIDYSLTEQDTGIKWINNKPIYQKTIFFGNLPNATSRSVNVESSDIDIIWIKPDGCYLYRTESNPAQTVSWPISFPSTSSAPLSFYFTVTCTASHTAQISCNAGTHDRTDIIAYITVQYTKTTDSTS